MLTYETKVEYEVTTRYQFEILLFSQKSHIKQAAVCPPLYYGVKSKIRSTLKKI